MPSPSQESNAAIAAYLAEWLQDRGFTVEELAYEDAGRRKVSLVARKGSGEGGLGLFSHSDTVPGDAGWDPFSPQIVDGRLVGRGACDMKGPLAATLLAAASVEPEQLRRPLTVVITADEEVGYGGAKQVIAQSRLLRDQWPPYSVIAEPTCLLPVYAHKGGVRVTVTAHGVAAHTSTDLGVSANFLIAPFMAEMAALAQRLKQDRRYQNDAFTPPTNGFNLVINDGGTKPNVTAAKTVCVVGFRPMPNDHSDEVLQMVLDAAARHHLEVEWYSFGPVQTDPSSRIIQAACAAAGVATPVTVPFGTEAAVYKDYTELVILGPGDIAQAHTVGEWIEIEQLVRAVAVYRRLIAEFCA
ncbi:MAG TPA: M20/M25/M40 family metallo-hydrolase [Caldilineaceae bacterium]|nr:M20/M25/M40 family metallo-hydrolase [Caldilineaceae bacterium]